MVQYRTIGSCFVAHSVELPTGLLLALSAGVLWGTADFAGGG